jgi:hypothetical protein
MCTKLSPPFTNDYPGYTKLKLYLRAVWQCFPSVGSFPIQAGLCLLPLARSDSAGARIRTLAVNELCTDPGRKLGRDVDLRLGDGFASGLEVGSTWKLEETEGPRLEAQAPSVVSCSNFGACPFSWQKPSRAKYIHTYVGKASSWNQRTCRSAVQKKPGQVFRNRSIEMARDMHQSCTPSIPGFKFQNSLFPPGSSGGRILSARGKRTSRAVQSSPGPCTVLCATSLELPICKNSPPPVTPFVPTYC